ncbi:MAG: GAF domain-containing protein [Planctomycetes bacterium]|nr:GAF domain-containing protein [Planctomycetota bacterium]
MKTATFHALAFAFLIGLLLSGAIFLARRVSTRSGDPLIYDGLLVLLGSTLLVVLIADERARARALEQAREQAATLERERARLQALLAHLPEPVILAEDPDGRSLRFNPAAAELVGRAPVRGAPPGEWARLYGPAVGAGDPASGAPGPLARALHKGESPRGVEVLLKRPDGSAAAFEAAASPLASADGQKLGAVSLLRDVSREREIRARMDKLAAEHARLSAEALERKARTERLTAEHARLGAEHTRLGVEHAKLGVELEARRRDAERAVADLARQDAESVRRLAALAELLHALPTLRDPQELAHAAASRTREAFAADACALYLPAEPASASAPAAATETELELAAAMAFAEDPGLLRLRWSSEARAACFEGTRPRLLAADKLDGGRVRERFPRDLYASLLALPIPHAGPSTPSAPEGDPGLALLAFREARDPAREDPGAASALAFALGALFAVSRERANTEARAELYRSLCGAGLELEGVSDADELPQRLATRARSLLGADLAFVTAYEPASTRSTWLAVDGQARVLAGVSEGPRLGVTWDVFQSRQPRRIDDLRRLSEEEAAAYPLLREEGIVAVLAVPLLRETEVRGVLAAGFRSPHFFGERELLAAEWLARLAGACLAEADRRQAAEKRARWLDAAQRLLQATGECEAPGQVLSVLLDKACATLELSAGAFFPSDAGTGPRRRPVPHRLTEEQAALLAAGPEGGLVGRVARTLEVQVVTDLSDATLAGTAGGLRESGFASFLGAPLVFQGRLVGVLCLLGGSARDFGRDEVEFLATLGMQAALWVRRALSMEEAQGELARSTALHELSASARGARWEEEIFRCLCARAAAAVGADGAATARLAASSQRLEVTEALGTLASARGLDLGPEETLLGKVASSGEALAVEAAEGSPPGGGLDETARRLRDLRGCAAVAIRGASGSLGALAVSRAEPRGFSAKELQFLQALGGVAAGAVERLRWNQRVEAEVRELSTEARRRGASLESLLESVPDGIALADESGKVSAWNRAAARLTGLEAGAAVGRPLSEALAIVDEDGKGLPLFPPGLACGEDAASGPGAGSGRPVLVEGSLVRPSGGPGETHVPIRAELSPLRQGGGGPTGWVAVLRDVTQERVLVDAIMRTNQARSEFLAAVSHELRTPLNSIIGFTEMLEACFFGPLTPKQTDYVRNVLASSRQLLGLINDLLDLSSVEAGRLELRQEAIPLPSAVEEVVSSLRPAALRKQIELEVRMHGTPDAAWGDPSKFRQILHNLLSNALKFTPEGRVVTVTGRRLELPDDRYPGLTLRAGVDGYLEFGVRDTGIGVAPEEHERIFQPFQRLDSSYARRHAGTGLGLPLTRRLVELHGGLMHLESAPGVGSTFFFVLPTRRAPAE